MVRSHLQWIRTRELAQNGAIGQLRAVVAAFSYYNVDPANIRNVPDWGGGGLMDIGCYPIQVSRFLFGKEPLRVSALIERDPQMGIDRLTSGMLDFGDGQAVFTCSTQIAGYQRVQVLGTKGRVEVEIPFNAPPDRPCRIFIDDGADVFGSRDPHGTVFRVRSNIRCRAMSSRGQYWMAARFPLHSKTRSKIWP